MRILIAEDDTISRLILQKAVQKFGHECLIAEDGLLAWGLYQREALAIDVVISDWMMPEIDGIELCRRIRAHPTDAYPYIILLTTLSDRAHVFAGLEAGADDYLSKPLDRDELRARLIAADRVTSLYRRLAERQAEIEAQKAEVERLNRQLFEQARRDPLTGLRNRLQLREDLDLLQTRPGRANRAYSIVALDVDRFKQYNDTYGHPAGDRALRAVADVLVRLARSGDLVYRYGGEEFLVLLAEATPGAAVVAAERLCRGIAALALTHGGNPPTGVVTSSAGVAGWAPGVPAAAILQAADDALYAAKASGRNRVVVAPLAGLPPDARDLERATTV